MESAIKLYERLGFHHLDQPLEGTEHGGCDVWMLKTFD
ncbi:putative acetyltransferase [Vibrio sinaloensis DSM 21326]|uniref:Putative acetyltransferase n=2 Tax=Photobacterium sp. (strain ATCC 43367) TaxID=379097 RepID=E8M920_PHOS4|nr:putative acetyltransferase [Vibrio sinaloensis DSM 21326]